MKPVTSHNSPPRSCSPGEKDFSWGSDSLITLIPIPMPELRLGVADITATEVTTWLSPEIEFKLGGAPKDCEMPN